MKVLTLGSDSLLTYSEALSSDFSRPVYIKREDLLSSVFGVHGHAIRKLGFLLPEMQDVRTTDVILVGRYGSHFMLTAVQLITCLSDIRTHCVFVDEFDPAYTSFMSALHMCNATTYGTYLGNTGIDQVNAITDMVKSTGGVPYVLLYEGTNSLAIMGGFNLFDELLVDLYKRLLLDGTEIGDCSIYVPVDSGATLVGMVAAREVALKDERLKHSVSITGVGSVGTIEEHKSFISDNFKSLDVLSKQQDFPIPDLETSQFTLSTVDANELVSDRLDFVKAFYRRTGVMLDPTYGYPTARMLCSDLAESQDTTPVIFINPAPLTRPYFSYNTTPDASGS